MFQQAKHIDTAFRFARGIALTTVLLSGIVMGYALFTTRQAIEQSQERIFVLANGKVFEALAGDRKDNIAVEARDHINTFHHYFFTLDPDFAVIQSNISLALYLADGTARQQYESLKENNYYANIISGNISQQLETDSIYVDTRTYPYYFRFYGKQKIIRPSAITTRSLQTQGYLRNVSRSDNNPHGFLIEKWKTIENKDLKTENR